MIGTRLRLLIVTVLAVIFSACGLLGPRNDRNPPRYLPDTIGLVVARSAPATAQYTLDDGQEIQVRPDEWISRGGADIGSLLLIGNRPQRWAFAIAPSPPFDDRPADCFALSASGGSVADGVIDALVPIRQAEPTDPQAAFFRFALGSGFDARYDSNGELVGNTLCLNAQGHATAYV